MAHAPESHAVVLAALSRLNSRYSREFRTALRLLLALQAAHDPPLKRYVTLSSVGPVPPPQPPNLLCKLAPLLRRCRMNHRNRSLNCHRIRQSLH